MLQGQYQVHLLSSKELPEGAFQEDSVKCKLYGYSADEWYFEPTDFSEDDENWFRVRFSIPEIIQDRLKKIGYDPLSITNIKSKHMSYMDVTGIIGGIKRQVRLELDEKWITGLTPQTQG
ncbi:hypothetical protein K8I28_07710 [bacterium]|nr:hypothetical protein [bacterium]